jgi:hypothetical protein
METQQKDMIIRRKVQVIIFSVGSVDPDVGYNGNFATEAFRGIAVL